MSNLFHYHQSLHSYISIFHRKIKNVSFPPRKDQISITGILIGLIIYLTISFLLFRFGTRINIFFTFLIPLLLLPIISAFTSSYITGNVFDGIIGVVISGIIIILFYISEFWGLFLKRLLNTAELTNSESLRLFVGGMEFFVVVIPIACVSLLGAFLGSKLTIAISEKRDKVSKEISFS